MTTKERWRCRVGHVLAATPNHVRNGGWCARCRGTGHGTLERVQEVAERRGGECLSTEYVSSTVDLLFRCREGHEWSAPPREAGAASVVTLRRWCEAPPAHARRHRAIAGSRGGACLSPTDINSQTPLLWRCFAGHEWWAIPSQVKHKSWCPTCAYKWRGTIDGMRALAAERGGRCVSTRYESHASELDIECAHGHRFRVSGRALKTGVSCPTCGAS